MIKLENGQVNGLWKSYLPGISELGFRNGYKQNERIFIRYI